jgi:hypothetical protein
VSESEKGNSAHYLWSFGVKGLLRVTRSDIRMGLEDRVGDEDLYMQRLLIEIGPRRRSIRLHVIHREDTDNCLHDHPWAFWSVILWGGYREEVPAPDSTPEEAARGYPRRVIQTARPFRFRFLPLDYKHRITELLRGRSITVAYAGPLEQHWGFHTAEGKLPWEDFVTEGRRQRVFWCDIR